MNTDFETVKKLAQHKIEDYIAAKHGIEESAN